MCICIITVECRPVKRADSSSMTASEGNNRGGVGTTYTVILVTDTGSGSASGEGDVLPDFEDVKLTDLTRTFYEIFGTSALEWLRKQKAP